MSSCDLTFQQVAFEAIRAKVAPGIDVSTHPAPGQDLPYVFIGESQLGDHEIGHEIQLTIHVWSSAEGSDQAKGLQHNVREALHTFNFTKNEWNFTCCREEYTNLILDPSKETWHGIQRFRVLASTL